MPIATIITRGFGSFSTVDEIPVRGYGKVATTATLPTVRWAWGVQNLNVDQHVSVVLALKRWAWQTQAMTVTGGGGGGGVKGLLQLLGIGT